MSVPEQPLRIPGRQDRPDFGFPARLGDAIVRAVTATLLFVGDMTVSVARGLRPDGWRRTMREEFVRCAYVVGVRAVPAVVVTALLVGVGLVLQILYWLELTGQKGAIGTFLVQALFRELAPLLTALIVIGRSGLVMLDEVGQMRVDGQIRMLESHGLDPVDLIAIPCAFATALSLWLLTIVFLHVALWTGYVCGSLAGLVLISPAQFIDAVLSTMSLGDHVLLLVKPLITGYVVGFLAIWLGLRVEPTRLSVRHALPRAFVLSVLATFVIGFGVSAAL